VTDAGRVGVSAAHRPSRSTRACTATRRATSSSTTCCRAGRGRARRDARRRGHRAGARAGPPDGQGGAGDGVPSDAWGRRHYRSFASLLGSTRDRRARRGGRRRGPAPSTSCSPRGRLRRRGLPAGQAEGAAGLGRRSRWPRSAAASAPDLASRSTPTAPTHAVPTRPRAARPGPLRPVSSSSSRWPRTTCAATPHSPAPCSTADLPRRVVTSVATAVLALDLGACSVIQRQGRAGWAATSRPAASTDLGARPRACRSGAAGCWRPASREGSQRGPRRAAGLHAAGDLFRVAPLLRA
jgi:hypothetical protein